MTNDELKAVYEYMGWETGEIQTLPCPKCGYMEKRFYFPVNTANAAWECAQEMDRKGDWARFIAFAFVTSSTGDDFTLWLYNPKNFFSCFGKWCLERRGK